MPFHVQDGLKISRLLVGKEDMNMSMLGMVLIIAGILVIMMDVKDKNNKS